MRPAWTASRRERDRGETRNASMIRSGPARFWPVVHNGKTFPLYEPKGLPACFDEWHVVGLPLAV